MDFVRTTTDPSSKDFVPPEDRIATFDQDGTLWVEHPLSTQAALALDRVHALAPQHPEWQSREPFKSVLSREQAAIGKFSEADWAEVIFLTHSVMKATATAASTSAPLPASLAPPSMLRLLARRAGAEKESRP